MKEYTTSELVIIMDDMKKSFEEFKITNSKEHESIMTKQDKTNGNVISLKLWRAWMTGAGVVLVFILGIIGLSLYNTFMNLNSDIQTKVSAAVKSELTDKYNIVIKP